MKTKIKLAGGSYGDEGKVIWTGDFPVGDHMGVRILDETDQNGHVVAYHVSQVAVAFNNSDMWQTLYVVPISYTVPKVG